MDKKSIQIKNIILILVGLAVTSFGVYKSVFYGCDIDESYAIALSYRIVQGDHLFKEMWELHQMSGIFMAPFIKIYLILNGTAIGIQIFLRIVGTLIQLAFGGVLYYVLTKYINFEHSFLIVLAYINFSPKFSQVLEFNFLEYLFYSGMIIGFLYYIWTKKRIFLCMIGFFQACSILVYPQILIIIPIEIIVLTVMTVKKKIEWKDLLAILGVEVLMGIIFLIYVLSGVSVAELISNIPYILSDGSHQMTFAEKMRSFTGEIAEYVIPILIGILLFEIIYRLLDSKQKNSRKFLLIVCTICYALCCGVFLVLKYKYTGIKHLYTSFFIIYLFETLLYFRVRFSKKYHDVREYDCITVLVFASFVACCFASNMVLYSNIGMLLPLVLFMWVQFLKADWSFDSSNIRQNAILVIPFAMFVIILLLSRVFLIRFTSVQPRYIFEDYYEIGVGAEKGVKVTENLHIMYHDRYAAVTENVTANDSLLIYGPDTYFYFLTGSAISAPTTISTPVYDENIYEYYMKYPYKVPTVIIVDTYYESIEKMLSIPKFGDWVKENYDIDQKIEYGYNTVIRKKNG